MPPAEDNGGYEVIQNEGTEHLIPEMDGIHQPLSTCVCDPIRAKNVRGPSGRDFPTFLHRSIPAPL